VRSIDYDRDLADLEAFLGRHDISLLRSCRAAVLEGDAYALVAERRGRVIGVGLIHVAGRDDLGWESGGETLSFVEGTGAYLGEIEVAAGERNRSVGTLLLREDDVFLHDTDRIRITVESKGHESTGWDSVDRYCLYCSCFGEPLEIVLRAASGP
jgi:hypothetical protein